MADTIFIQLHIGDFIGDTLDMDATEIGAYWLLLIAHYKNGVIGIPSDDAKLRRITRISDRRIWKRVKEILLSKFTEKDGWLTNGRVIEEIQKRTSKAKAVHKVSELTDDLENESVRKSVDKPLENHETQKHNHKPITNNQEKDKKEITSNDLEGSADDFFNAYPEPARTGIGAVKRAFADQVFFHNANPGQMVKAAKNFARKHSDTEGKFIPKPLRFLNEQMYLDADLQAEPPKPLDLSGEPEWKQNLAKLIGPQILTWLKEAEIEGNRLIVPKRHEANWLNEKHKIDFSKIGITEITHRGTA